MTDKKVEAIAQVLATMLVGFIVGVALHGAWDGLLVAGFAFSLTFPIARRKFR